MKYTTVFALVSAGLAVGCAVDEPLEERSPIANGGGAFVHGSVGRIVDMDSGSIVDVFRERDAVQFSGDVPHQSLDDTKVFVSVRIANIDALAIGGELEQEGLKDTWRAMPADGAVVDVYLCPNGDGVSGFADFVRLTRTRDSGYALHATSSNAEQNLDVDLILEGWSGE
jgi:hypothetical protein